MNNWPSIINKEVYLKNLLEVLESDIWTIRAQRPSKYLTEKFEEEWADFCGTKYALLVSSGSSALEISLRAINIGVGDEVIIPALGWYATAAAVTRVGATPIFCDVDLSTTCIDEKEASKLITSKTKAIIAVHLHCSFAPLLALKDLCNQHNIILIEDAAQAHGGTYLNRSPGHHSLAACYSFNQEKLIPSGEGGAIVTNDESFYKKAYALRTDGYINHKKSEWVPSGILGANFAISEFQAAILLGSLKEFTYFNQIRLENASKLTKLLEEIEGIKVISQPLETTNKFYYELGIIFSTEILSKITLDNIIGQINSKNIIMVDRTDYPVPDNPLFKPYYNNKKLSYDLSNAMKVYNNLIVFHHRYLLNNNIPNLFGKALRDILTPLHLTAVRYN